jgi:hypothetical protein
MMDAHGQIDPTQGMEWHCAGDGSCTATIKPIPPAGGEVGTAQAGSPSEEASAPAAPSGLDPVQASPAVRGTAQAWGGFFVGLGLGLTPGGAVADQVLTGTNVLDRGTHQAQVGKAIGAMLGGFFLTASGVAGEIVGTGLTTTGIGSLIGVPAMAVSAGLVASGTGNMAAGLRGFSEALMSSGSGGGEQAAGGGSTLLNPSGLLGRQGPAEMTKSRIGKMAQAMKEGKFDWDAAGPIRVAERDGTRIIIDGHHRAAAARQAGLSGVPVRVEQVTDEVWNRLLMEAAEAGGR